MDSRCITGGILRLLELIDTHTVAISSDFRSLYNLSIFEVGETYTYKEAIYLTAALYTNPNSLLFTSINEWDFPVSREFLALADLYDLTFAVNSKKKVKYPRPFKMKTDGQKIGNTTKSKSEVEKLLKKMNPNRK